MNRRVARKRALRAVVREIDRQLKTDGGPLFANTKAFPEGARDNFVSALEEIRDELEKKADRMDITDGIE